VSIIKKAKPLAGALIRKVIFFLRQKKMTLPYDKIVTVALSGGSDSIALAHLLAVYGKRIVDKKNLRFVHVHHGIRGKSADEDASFVKNFAENLGVECFFYQRDPEKIAKKSVEQVLRAYRKSCFDDVCKKTQAKVWTAHHADDLAETVLWRIFTGCLWSHGKGIQFETSLQIRPFLSVRKKTLQDYLLQEEQFYREDETNFNNQFLRSRLRLSLMPSIEEQFPQAVSHLCAIAQHFEQQKDSFESQNAQQAFVQLLSALGVRPRRVQIEQFFHLLKTDWTGSFDLAKGFCLVRHPEKNR
jgi:tRNA(Ile)-lysidine synthetase-like protein